MSALFEIHFLLLCCTTWKGTFFIIWLCHPATGMSNPEIVSRILLVHGVLEYNHFQPAFTIPEEMELHQGSLRQRFSELLN